MTSEAPTLRPYQEAMLTAIANARAAGLTRLLCKSSTGTGKTVAFAAMLRWPALAAWLETVPRKGCQMLIIAHREELLDQSAAKIQDANPGIMVSIEQGDRHANAYSDVVIASIQTLSAMKFRRLHRLLQRHQPRIVIIDEAHHAAASTYRTALVHMGFLPTGEASDAENIDAPAYDDVALMEEALKGWDATAPKDRLLVGVTATPNRSDAIGLNCVFQSLVYSYGLKDAINDGWLVPPVPWVIETDTSLDDVRVTHGEFNQRDLGETVNTPARNRLAVAAWREHAEHLPTLGFTVNIAHAHDLAAAFVASGYRWAALSGETPKEDRRVMLRQYREGQIEGIANCMVLTEGADFPLTACILHVKPTKSATLYEQMSGRGFRLHPDDPSGPERLEAERAGARFLKAQCIVLDLVDVARKHSLQTAPVLYGLPPGIKTDGDDLRKMEGDLEALKEKYPGFDVDALLAGEKLTITQLGAKASSFDIWTVQDLGAFGAGRTLNWIRTGAETFRLQYPWSDGTETLQIEKDLLGHWVLSRTLRSHTGGPAKQNTLSTEISTADAAAAIAEAYVLAERRSVTKLKDKDAPWRSRPASSKQLALLRRWRVPHDPRKLTMGQCSDLIDLAQSRKTR